MKSAQIAFLVVLLSIPSQAGETARLLLTESGHFSSGHGARSKEIEVNFSKGLQKEPMSVEEKVAALERQIAFYRIMVDKKVDLGRMITATYENKPLREILEGLLPDIAVEFKGVDRDETVGSFKIKNAPLEKVLHYLDDAAGVYFSYSEDGILVTADPR